MPGNIRSGTPESFGWLRVSVNRPGVPVVYERPDGERVLWSPTVPTLKPRVVVRGDTDLLTCWRPTTRLPYDPTPAWTPGGNRADH